MNGKNSAIEVRDLTVRYDGSTALSDITLDLPQGKLIGILGPNGAGKSTFIKTLVGLIKPVSGTVLFFGKPFKASAGRIAYLPQRETIDWRFPITVKDLVLMGRYPRIGWFRWITKADVDACRECLEMVGMLKYLDRQISELSGGEQQRAFLARALLQDADMYFLDESLSGVDHTSEEIIIDILQKMVKKQKTICMVYHDLNTAGRYFDWMVLLKGRLIAAGSKEDVFTPENLAKAYY